MSTQASNIIGPEPGTGDHVAVSVSVENQPQKRPSRDASQTDGEPVKKPKKSPSPGVDSFDEKCTHSFLERFLEPVDEENEEERQIFFDWLFQKNLLKTPPCCPYCQERNLHLKLASETWECEDCKRSFSIRMNSFFDKLTCPIKDILRCVMAWCNKKSISAATKVLSIKISIISRIYQQCLETILNYLLAERSKDLSLGGTGSVALLDLWPSAFIPISGATRDLKRKSYADRLRVLWIADTNHIPVRYVAHLLPRQLSLEKLKDKFKNITKDFGVFPRPEFDIHESMSCEDGPNIDEPRPETLSDIENSSSGSGENRPQRLEPRILREQQEVANSQENKKQDIEIKCQKSNHKKENQMKRKLQCPENKSKDRLHPLKLSNNDESWQITHCDSSQNLEEPKEDINVLEVQNKVDVCTQFHDEADELLVDNNLPYDAIKIEPKEGNVAPHNFKPKKKKRSRMSPNELAMREVEKLQQKQSEEYTRDIELAHSVIQVAVDYIKTGSLVVVNDETLPYVASSLHQLGEYESVQTVNDLISTGDEAIISILENIWNDAAAICSNLHCKTYHAAEEAVALYQWHQQFSSTSEAVSHLLLQIPAHYHPLMRKSKKN